MYIINNYINILKEYININEIDAKNNKFIVSMSDNKTSFINMKFLLNNTLFNFKMSAGVEECFCNN